MKKEYIMPAAEKISFQPEEALMTGDTQAGPSVDTGTETLPGSTMPWSLRL